MTMAEIRLYRRQLRDVQATRNYRRLLVSASGGLLVLSFAFAMLIVLAV